MRLPGPFRKALLALTFVVMLTAGYMAMSVATSCPVEAAAGACGCQLCVVPAGVATSFAAITAQVVTQVGAATGLITANYALAATAFGMQAVAEFNTIATDLDDWFDTFWFYQLRPAMQDQTEQINTLDMAQAVNLSTHEDAHELARTDRQRSEQEIEAERVHRPGQQVCVAGTMAGGLMRANTVARAYARAAPAEAAERSLRGGAAADTAVRFNDYATKYCDPSENNGNAACAGATPRMNADIDVTGQVFSKDTIDLRDPETKQAVDTLITNVAEPKVPENIPEGAVDSAAGAEAMMAREAMRAKRQAIHNALYFTVSRRAPGSRASQHVADLRTAAGIPTDMLSDNPSQYEMMEVMMNERFRSGKYSVEQIDTPENNERELVIQSAFQVMQMHDHLDLLDRYALMLAAQTGIEAAEIRPHNAQTESRPIR